MNQKLASVPQPPPQKDWSGAIATLSINFLDLKKELQSLQAGIQNVLNTFAAKIDELDKRTAPIDKEVVDGTPKAA